MGGLVARRATVEERRRKSEESESPCDGRE